MDIRVLDLIIYVLDPFIGQLCPVTFEQLEILIAWQIILMSQTICLCVLLNLTTQCRYSRLVTRSQSYYIWKGWYEIEPRGLDLLMVIGYRYDVVSICMTIMMGISSRQPVYRSPWKCIDVSILCDVRLKWQIVDCIVPMLVRETQRGSRMERDVL